jgi:hypothetical protein
MLQTSFRTEKCEIFGWNCLLIAHSRPLTIIIIFRYSIYWYTEFLNKIFAHYQNVQSATMFAAFLMTETEPEFGIISSKIIIDHH